jgi:Transcriptional regulator C-terminal region
MDISRKQTISDWHHHYPQATEQRLDFLYTFIINGSVAVIEQWVRTGMQETPPELGEMAQTCVDVWLRAQS